MENLNEWGSTLDAAKENKEETLDKIQRMIAIVEELLKMEKLAMEKLTEKEKKQDVYYVPDYSEYNQLAEWLDALYGAKDMIEGIEIKPEELMSKSNYFAKAQSLVNIIESRIPDNKDNFLRSNINKFESSVEKKIGDEERYKQLNEQLEELKARKEELIDNSLKLDLKSDELRYGIIESKKGEKLGKEILRSDNKLNTVEKVIRDLMAERQSLKIDMAKNHYYDTLIDPQDINMEENNNDSEEELEQGE